MRKRRDHFRFSFLYLILIETSSLLALEPVRLDRYNDPLPPGVLARLGTERLRHGGGITCLAYSTDGKLLASGCLDRAIVLWDAQSGKKIRQFEPVRTLDISPDGKLLVSGSQNGPDGDLRLWDSATGKCLHSLGGVIGATFLVAFSPDGKMIASGHGRNTIRFWDPTTGKVKRTWAGVENDHAVSSLACLTTITFPHRVASSENVTENPWRPGTNTGAVSVRQDDVAPSHRFGIQAINPTKSRQLRYKYPQFSFRSR